MLSCYWAWHSNWVEQAFSRVQWKNEEVIWFYDWLEKHDQEKSEEEKQLREEDSQYEAQVEKLDFERQEQETEALIEEQKDF